ncbi:amidohydrolase [Arthrobacter sp. TES]|uniref:M20 family metallopeptidase n=1 Tax=Paenarthrobacter ureafaciens TaxID=37931 RepID=A0AAX3EG81_PAEUR|nr:MULTISPECIES: M20 family metallopeptidase [Paenarthrobacter]AOY69768.1 amidohydrolase [Arthrobacter sp. ZXY-2]ERI37185.1 amidohydrolase [Arthrobacter sp. AK-YN10]NKR14072.1 amidohydrolase [Arthrobacter sp. M5]NKR17894.1 amidohydrolase [Arthrobacter sp. M6]OEH56882.1 amidohydrolase [Arthrobacter sp. D4]OEH63860.1 amidohydrolase [Arthrobacter sp. D2]QOI62108.1 amidohydrolase [Arthrobacter sp. TES]
MTIAADAQELREDIVRLRHQLHREPEIGLHLPRTQEKVLQALDGLPYEITLGKDTTSVTAVLRGGAAHASARKPVVLLRADMDGLPVQETTGVDYTSRVDGAMHACGHDLHTSMLAGAATLLAERRHQIAGDVVLMFQPGEEGFDGASYMINEGVLDAAGRRADTAYGMHVFSSLEPHGQFVTKDGVMLSSSDGLVVTVLGAGGHGSAPHSAKDPVTAAAEMVTALQVMVTRQFNMFDPVVLTVGVLHAGTKRNVIPETARIEATIRTFSEASRQKMMEAVPRLLKGIAAAHGLEVDVDYQEEYPLTINDEDETNTAEKVIAGMFGDSRLTRMATPLSGSEDFSRVLAEVPGTFVGLSAVAPGADPSTSPFNHSPYATFDDGVLTDGAALYAELAVSRIAALAAN